MHRGEASGCNKLRQSLSNRQNHSSGSRNEKRQTLIGEYVITARYPNRNTGEGRLTLV